MTMTDDVYLGTGAVPHAGKMTITQARVVPRRIVRLGIPTTYDDTIVIPTPVPDTLSQLPIILNLTMYSGDDFSIRLTVNDLDGSPPELASVQILAQIRASIGSNVAATLVPEIDKNIVKLTLPPDVSKNMSGAYVWDVQATDYYGKVQTFAGGIFFIVDDVSRPAPIVIPPDGGGGGPIPGPVPGADWTNSTDYSIGDIARDPQDGLLYTCTLAHTSASAPTTFAVDRVFSHPGYWSLPSTEGGDEEIQKNWQNSKAYAVGEIVRDSTDLMLYTCLVAHTSAAPPMEFVWDRNFGPNMGKWSLGVQPEVEVPNWANSTAYVISEIVRDPQDGTVWSCAIAHTSASAPTKFAQERLLTPENILSLKWSGPLN